jgi:hypothetical protein
LHWRNGAHLSRRASLASGRVVQCIGESRYFDDATVPWRTLLRVRSCPLRGREGAPIPHAVSGSPSRLSGGCRAAPVGSCAPEQRRWHGRLRPRRPPG